MPEPKVNLNLISILVIILDWSPVEYSRMLQNLWQCFREVDKKVLVTLNPKAAYLITYDSKVQVAKYQV